MTRPLYIALLELKLFLNNRAELAFSIALPILLFALMYGALSSESDVFTPASVVDLDGGVHARELVERLDSLAAVEVEERSEPSAEGAPRPVGHPVRGGHTGGVQRGDGGGGAGATRVPPAGKRG